MRKEEKRVSKSLKDPQKVTSCFRAFLSPLTKNSGMYLTGDQEKPRSKTVAKIKANAVEIAKTPYSRGLRNLAIKTSESAVNPRDVKLPSIRKEVPLKTLENTFSSK